MTAPHQHAGMSLLDYINELTRPHEHREHYTQKIGKTTYGKDHVTSVPPLLHQLRYATASGLGEERSGGGYESRPAASLDALDTLTRIDLQASAWLRDLGEDDPPDTSAVLRRLGALWISQPAPTKRELERDVRRWWAQARVITGWDSPAWRPDNSCPMCAEHGALRVRLAEKIGLCVECRETWDETNIGLLADHIRAESAGQRSIRDTIHCWCPWPGGPGSRTGRWPALCTSCASSYCHRAGATSERATRRPAGGVVDFSYPRRA